MAGMHENSEDLRNLIAPVRHMKVLSKAARCRVCQKLLCCIKCKMEHEKNKHLISSDERPSYEFSSDLFREKKYLTQTTLKNDVQDEHFPIHCVYCSLTFDSKSDLENLLIKKSPCLQQVENRCHLLVASRGKGKYIEHQGKRKRSTVHTSTPEIMDETVQSGSSHNRQILVAGHRKTKIPVSTPKHNCSSLTEMENSVIGCDSFDNLTEHNIKETPNHESGQLIKLRCDSATSTPYYDAISLSICNNHTKSECNNASPFECDLSPTNSEQPLSGACMIPTAVIRETPITSSCRGIMRKSFFNSSSKPVRHDQRRVTFHNDTPDSLGRSSCLPVVIEEVTPEDLQRKQKRCHDDDTDTSVLAFKPIKSSYVADGSQNVTRKILLAISSAWKFALYGIKSTFTNQTFSSGCPTPRNVLPHVFHFGDIASRQHYSKKVRLSLPSNMDSENFTPQRRNKTYYNIKRRSPIAGMRFKR